MAEIGIRELRDTLTQTIRRVRAGERFTVTHDRKPIALIVPYPDDRLSRLIAEGRARPPLRATTYPLPEPGVQTGPTSASEALADDRGD